MTVFSFDGFRDLFEKSKYEMQMMETCRSHPDYDYLLFNVTVSVNHLFEWCIRDKNLDENIRLECVKRFNPYETPYDVPRDFHGLYKKIETFPVVNEEQLVIRQLCNKAKHFKKTNVETQSRKNISVCGVMRCGDRLCQFHYQYDVEISNSEKKLNVVLSEMLDKWGTFINEIV